MIAAPSPSAEVLQCARLLAQKKLSFAAAESATAGRLCAEFALTPHSGQILVGGLVCYDAGIKEQLLKVSASLVDKYTPESAEVTEAMAKGLSRLVKAEIHIAITGLVSAGGSETKEKPVGTMFMHILMGKQELKLRKVFDGKPNEVILQTIDYIAAELCVFLKGKF